MYGARARDTMSQLYILLSAVLDFYSWIIVIYILMSWFRPTSGLLGTIYDALAALVEPYLALFRRLIPSAGGLDFSPMAAIFALVIVRMILRMLFTSF